MEEILLINEPSIEKLFTELKSISRLLIFPAFGIALIKEYLSNFDFIGVLKALIISVLFLSYFPKFHQEAVKMSLKTSTELLNKISPNNKFFGVAKSEKENKNLFETLLGGFEDLVANFFYFLSRIFSFLLKLIYSSVFHLTYVFSGLSAVFYLAGFKGSINGMIRSSVWCMTLPFILICIIAIIGNAINFSETSALNGIEKILWLFGVNLLMLIAPAFTFSLIKDSNISASGTSFSSLNLKGGSNTYKWTPRAMGKMRSVGSRVSRSIGVKR